jgi:hypothetical protein
LIEVNLNEKRVSLIFLMASQQKPIRFLKNFRGAVEELDELSAMGRLLVLELVSV